MKKFIPKFLFYDILHQYNKTGKMEIDQWRLEIKSSTQIPKDNKLSADAIILLQYQKI